MSDAAAPQPTSPSPKAAPEALALRAQPRPVTRLSKKALVALMGVSAIVIGGAGLWALKPHIKAPGKSEAPSTDRKPTAEGLLSLPTSYAGVTAQNTATTSVFPKLGPPLPGDLGGPIHNAQAAADLAGPGATQSADQTANPTAAQTVGETARQRRVQEATTALTSGLFAASSRMSTSGATPTDVGLTNASLGVGAPPAPSVSTAAAQTGHDAFLKPEPDTEASTTSAHRLIPPASPYFVMAGSTISAALVTGLNSDLPGQVIAIVTTPVYDTPTGRILLIPQGARLLGSYDSGVGFGETRALLVWTRLILPDGASIVLDKTPATDAAGYAGVSDQVDNHWKQLVAGAALSTLLGAGAELAAPQNQTSGSSTVVVATREGLQDNVNQVGQELTRKNLSVKPTLTVRPGYPVRVLVNRDLVLRPYVQP